MPGLGQNAPRAVSSRNQAPGTIPATPSGSRWSLPGCAAPRPGSAARSPRGCLSSSSSPQAPEITGGIRNADARICRRRFSGHRGGRDGVCDRGQSPDRGRRLRTGLLLAAAVTRHAGEQAIHRAAWPRDIRGSSVTLRRERPGTRGSQPRAPGLCRRNKQNLRNYALHPFSADSVRLFGADATPVMRRITRMRFPGGVSFANPSGTL